MKFIVGLGNPDAEYNFTKHNIGFNVIKAIAKEAGIKINEKIYVSLVGRGKIAGEEVMLVLPQTYMNLSGHAVGEIYNNEIKSLGDLIVICDDINLKLGRIRLKKSGSSGGHKGLESIINMLGRDDFARLKVGIEIDPHKGDITNYVLTPFKKKQIKNVSHAISLAKDAVIFLMKNGIDKTMSKFNRLKTATS